MDKLTALKIFCSVADTLQFRETASRLAISPQVVSRIIGELEQELGESLFQRNTRQVQLSDFGQQILPSAKQIVAESEQLFEWKNAAKTQDLSGIVRITVPNAPLMHAVLPKLLVRLKDYPQLHLDWRMEMKLSDKIAERIDLGIRMGNPPNDNSLIVKQATQIRLKLVASPDLIKRLGMPENLQNLMKTYPLAAHLNDDNGRLRPWYFSDELIFTPDSPHFVSNNLQALLEASLSGQCVAFLHNTAADPYLATGELMELFPEHTATAWGVYLYRPYRHITPVRVKWVFDLLAEILAEM